ncbi:hypothetical protein [uncultured Brevundimonas sp.]|uniref:hypothetical protein n=1 Tax=uncultured Brevundimonas sp. TaxID=213418 RepID=UPI00260F74FA|nr:hypothetical protein [uncultured Brevundimonas sp.]
MGSLTVPIYGFTLALALLFGGQDPLSAERQLQMTGQGRFTYFADLSTVADDGNGVRRLRALQLSDEPMMIGDVAFIGGWSNWSFDCVQRTARRIDFSSLRSDGVEGPATPVQTGVYPLSPGGDAAELAAVACGEIEQKIDARNLNEAIALASEID